MPKATVSTTATATTTHELRLAPQVKRRLLTSLRVYGELNQQLKAIKLAMSKAKGNVKTALVDSGESSISLDGYKATYVSPTRSHLDKQKLIAQGVTIAMLEMATVTKPGKSYVKISTPSGDEDDEE